MKFSTGGRRGGEVHIVVSSAAAPGCEGKNNKTKNEGIRNPNSSGNGRPPIGDVIGRRQKWIRGGETRWCLSFWCRYRAEIVPGVFFPSAVVWGQALGAGALTPGRPLGSRFDPAGGFKAAKVKRRLINSSRTQNQPCFTTLLRAPSIIHLKRQEVVGGVVRSGHRRRRRSLQAQVCCFVTDVETTS